MLQKLEDKTLIEEETDLLSLSFFRIQTSHGKEYSDVSKKKNGNYIELRGGLGKTDVEKLIDNCDEFGMFRIKEEYYDKMKSRSLEFKEGKILEIGYRSNHITDRYKIKRKFTPKEFYGMGKPENISVKIKMEYVPKEK